MSLRQRDRLHKTLLEWYAAHGRDLPWRRPPWADDPYAILVSEVMLQQTQVERVLPKHREFLARFPDFRSLARAPLAEVIRVWSPLGYNLRAVRLWRVARRVVGEFGGALPSGMESLRGLEGVGSYTAAAVACFAFGQEIAVVDTNVRRVLGRVLWGLEPPAAPELAAHAQTLVPRGRASEWSQALMDLGATVCLARSPRCVVCPLRRFCIAAPLLADGAPRVAEALARYRTAPFKGSRRYYRGRIVERLRRLAPGESIALGDLGRAVRSSFGDAHIGWLCKLVAGLERDGLVRVKPAGGPAPEARVSLP